MNLHFLRFGFILDILTTPVIVISKCLFAPFLYRFSPPSPAISFCLSASLLPSKHHLLSLSLVLTLISQFIGLGTLFRTPQLLRLCISCLKLPYRGQRLAKHPNRTDGETSEAVTIATMVPISNKLGKILEGVGYEQNDFGL
jgi:hypothetical protein